MCRLQKSMISCSRRGLAGLERDEGLGPLAPLLVRDGHHRALHHRGVPGHALLDLDGRDVLAARDDDVLLAVAQLDVAVGVPDPDVARVEPAAAEGLGGRLRLLVVALGHVVADHHHLAQRLAVAAARRSSPRPPPGPGRRGRSPGPAARPGAPARSAGSASHSAFQPQTVCGPVGLGEAVDVHRPEAELLELAEQGRRGRGAGHRHRHRPREPVRLGVVDHADLHGGRAVVVGDALGVDQVPDATGLDLAGGRRASRPPRSPPR